MDAYMDTEAQTDPSQWTLLQRLKESSHPVAVLFYLGFRIGPVLLYLFGMLFTANFVLVFVLLAILLSFDFWNTKNISGRLLVGLRWWNETSESGESIWVFENADPQRYINPVDSKVFWLFIYITPICWGVLGVVAVLKFHFLWLLMVAFALVLTTTNTYAFSQCDKFGRASSIMGQVQNGVLSRTWGLVTGRLFG